MNWRPIHNKTSVILIGAAAFFLVQGFGSSLFLVCLSLSLMLGVAKNCKTASPSKTLAINFILTFFTLGALSTSVNAAKKIAVNASSFKESHTSADGAVVKIHEKDDLLGYKNKPNIRAIATKKSYSGSEISFSSTYTINNRGNRRTLSLYPRSQQSALFLGGSLTFGTGLNDDQTLPSLFHRISRINSINAGVAGYGIHQTYAILKNIDLYTRTSEGGDISIVIYRMLVNHINRAAGYASWDVNGPCYKLNSLNQLILTGSFKKCGSRNNFLTSANFLVRREPATGYVLKQIRTSNYINEIYDPGDIQTTRKMLIEMRDISESRGAQFIVILEDFTRKISNNPCAVDPHSEAVKQILLNAGIRTILTSSFLSVERCNKGAYDIKYDGHPSEERNQETALAVWKFIDR